jgi:FkbM family methyltransferase
MITKVVSFSWKGNYAKLEVRPDTQDEFMARNEVFNNYYFKYGKLEIKEGDTVFDLGANIGAFTILAGMEKAKRIIAVEPFPDTIALLERNIKANERLFSDPVTIFKGAVMGANDDHATLLLNNDPFGSGSHTLTPDERYKPVGQKEVDVKAVTLDKLIEMSGVDRIDFLKCDIEGAEYEVIENCTKLDMVKQMSFEWHRGPVNFAKFLIFLKEHGFSVAWFEGDDHRGKLQVRRV